MTKVMQRRSVEVADPGRLVTLSAPAARFVLRGDGAVMQAASAIIGAVPSTVACRAVSGHDWSALWQGPDEQLLLGPAKWHAGFEAALETALQGLPHSLVDVSHRQVGVELTGPRAATLLNSACPLDLDQAAFPVTMVTRTVFAKAEITLWRRAPEHFHIEVWRSYADYLVALLNIAAASG
jgi:sarcosine oxidase subunit gamma